MAIFAFTSAASLAVPSQQVSNYIEVSISLLSYAPLIPRIRSFLRGFPRSTKGAVVGYPPHLLVFHIVLSLFMTTRHILRLAIDPAPSTTTFDFALGIFHAVSTWILSKNTPITSTLWKASFQTMISLYMVCLVKAFLTGSTEWYISSARFISWFVTFRWVLSAAQKYHMFREVHPYAAVHLISVPIALCWMKWSAAIPVYYVGLGAAMSLNEWVTKQVPHR